MLVVVAAMPFVISLMSVGDGYRDVTGADGDSGLRCYTGGGRGVGLRGWVGG